MLAKNKIQNVGPQNPVADFVDEYGENQTIHRKKGRRLSVYRKNETPVHLMNRAAAVLFGQNVRAQRTKLGMTMKDVALKAGLCTSSPKQYIHKLESGFRAEGVRMGSLFALAYALECEPSDLLPSHAAVVALAGVKPSDISPLSVGA